MWMHTWNGAGRFAFGFPWGGLAMAAIVIASVVLLVVVLVRLGRFQKSGAKGGAADTQDAYEGALAILAERFARGEIDAAAFKSMREELVGK